MEHFVIMEKLCSCAKKEGLEQVITYDSKEDAKSAADIQAARITQSFCGKHTFDVTEVNDHFVIGVIGGGGGSSGGCGCGTHEKH